MLLLFFFFLFLFYFTLLVYFFSGGGADHYDCRLPSLYTCKTLVLVNKLTAFDVCRLAFKGRTSTLITPVSIHFFTFL